MIEEIRKIIFLSTAVAARAARLPPSSHFVKLHLIFTFVLRHWSPVALRSKLSGMKVVKRDPVLLFECICPAMHSGACPDYIAIKLQEACQCRSPLLRKNVSQGRALSSSLSQSQVRTH